MTGTPTPAWTDQSGAPLPATTGTRPAVDLREIERAREAERAHVADLLRKWSKRQGQPGDPAAEANPIMAARARAAEFLRQWSVAASRGDVIFSVYADASGIPANLLASDVAVAIASEGDDETVRDLRERLAAAEAEIARLRAGAPPAN